MRYIFILFLILSFQNLYLDAKDKKILNYSNKIIVKFKPKIKGQAGFSISKKAESFSKNSGKYIRHHREMDGGYDIFELDGNYHLSEIDAIIKKLKKDSDIEIIAPVKRAIPLNTFPNDAMFNLQWHYHLYYGDEPAAVNLPLGWDIERGKNSVVIAVLDTGILNHVDIDNSRIVPGYDMISDINKANDGNGRDSNPSDPGDWEEEDKCCPGCGPYDSSWHGLHVTGTIGANTNNSIGVSGVNWYSRILPVRVLGKCGGDETDIVDGIRWAAGLSVSGVPVNTNPARVINLSLGGSGACNEVTGLQEAINAAVSQGAIIVAAAGNDNEDVSNMWPANCNNVISVASVNRAGNKASYSNYGNSIIISAPGGESGPNNGVYSTYNTGTTMPGSDTYAEMYGTSMAAPHVSGIVSLMLSTQPALSFNDVVYNIRQTAHLFPYGSSCNTSICGTGIIDAYFALRNLQLQIFSITPNKADNDKTVSITDLSGKGFLQGATVKLKKLGQPDINATNVNVVNLNKITCDFPITGAAGGNWDVVITNPDSSVYNLSGGFTIEYASPVVNYIIPYSASNDEPVQITDLNGNYFRTGATVKLTRAGYSDINATNVVVVNSNKITCTLPITGAASGLWDVRVTNPDGRYGVLSNGFGINMAAPVVVSITPNKADNNGIVSITNLAGSGFIAPAQVKLKKAGYADINAFNVSVVNSTKITCNFQLNGAEVGLWDVQVINPDTQSSILTSAFTVEYPSPTVSAISPNTGLKNEVVNISDISGSNFVNGAVMKLTKLGETDINCQNNTVLSSSKMTCSLSLSNATTGYWNVKVVNPDGKSGTLLNGFTVKNKGPSITSLNKDFSLNNVNADIEIYGSNFLSGATVKLSKAGYSDINAINVVTVNSSKITCTLPINGKTPGEWELVVTNPDLNSSSYKFKIISAQAEDFKVYGGVFNPNQEKTYITTKINSPGKVSVKVYDQRGRYVATIYEGERNVGSYCDEWDGRNADNKKVSSGIYFIHIETPQSKQIKRVVVVK